MPNGSERRQSTRHVVQLPFLHKAGRPLPMRAGVGWTRNLCEGGACVELAERLQVELPLRVRLQTERGPLDLEGRVVWAADPASGETGILHGVAFDPIPPDRLQALRDLLLPKGEMRPAGVRLPVELSVTCQPRGQAGPPLHGQAVNVSRGGLLVRLPEVLPRETVVVLTLHTPHGPFTAEGAVVWVDPLQRRTPGEPIRHGLRFTALGWSSALSLGLVLVKPTHAAPRSAPL